MRREHKLVRVAHAAVETADGVLVTVGLGSCVAILLHDPVVRVGGLAHVLLPEPTVASQTTPPTKFVSTAVPYLIAEMECAGADRARLVARLVGGASMFSSLAAAGLLQTGERNLVAARAALGKAGVPIVGEEVGKEHGRSVYFYPDDGRAVVSSYRHAQVLL